MRLIDRINVPNIECANSERPIGPGFIYTNYVWSVSVPSFVCIGPMCKRKL